MLTLLVSEEDRKLLEDIEEIAFGELYNVSRGKQDGSRRMEVSSCTASFLKALWKNERFDRVTLHDGEPASAEVLVTTPNGRKALQKFRFS